MSIGINSLKMCAFLIIGLLPRMSLAARKLSTEQTLEFALTLKRAEQVNEPVCPADGPLVKCEIAINRFCKDLYDPKNPNGAGNLDVEIGGQKVPLRLGKDSHDISFNYASLSQARLKNSKDFPTGFKKYLDQYNYFSKLKKVLDTGKITTLTEKRAYRDLASASSKAWNNSFNDAVDDALNAKHPNFQAVSPMPPRWQLERGEIEKDLNKRIAKATWEHSPAWGRVQAEFKEVQKAYIEELEKSQDIPAENKKNWIERIKTVQLKIPGSEDYMLDNNECAETEQNGTYFAEQHAFTVCAGAFNSADFLLMTSHELSHSIGESRDLHLARSNAPITPAFLALTQELCEHQPAGCSKTWLKIKADLLGPKTMLEPLSHYSSQAGSLRACLQYRPPVQDEKKLEIVVAQAAEELAHERRSDLAGRQYFLDSVKATSTLDNGKEAENLGYLNPCYGQRFKAENYSFTNALPTFYLAEYQCLAELPPEKRMAEAIKLAETTQRTINVEMIPVGGPFSRSSVMIQNSFSSDSEERFADWMGSRVMARVISARSLDAKSRMNLMASNLASLCDPPNNADRYASEAQVEKEFDDEPHSLKSARRNEIMSLPIRTALGCKASGAKVKECKF